MTRQARTRPAGDVRLTQCTILGGKRAQLTINLNILQICDSKSPQVRWWLHRSDAFKKKEKKKEKKAPTRPLRLLADYLKTVWLWERQTESFHVVPACSQRLVSARTWQQQPQPQLPIVNSFSFQPWQVLGWEERVGFFHFSRNSLYFQFVLSVKVT